jgi:four helix bundle protein
MERRVRYHTDLDVWQLSKDLAVDAYRATLNFPRTEQFSLVDQIRRAAVSVPANIAEGCGRGTTREMIRSLRIARGSLSELHSHLIIASELGFLHGDAPMFEYVGRVHRMLNGLIGSLQRKLGTAPD